MGIPIYDRQGNPISMARWGELLADDDYRSVAATEVNGYMISTVWLGLDHGRFSGGVRYIFETMVFAPHDGADVDCMRYSTEEEALAGHEEFITLLEATTQPLQTLGKDADEIRQEER